MDTYEISALRLARDQLQIVTNPFADADGGWMWIINR